MNRQVEREWLDELPPDDPRAIHSRHDLQRLNAWMGHVGIIKRNLIRICRKQAPKRIIELGGGDGTFLLQLARRLAPQWPSVQVRLIDRQSLVNHQTKAGLKELSWTLEPIQADVLDWLQHPAIERSDLMLANLFLHHFSEPALRALLGRAAELTKAFVACEPRRCFRSFAATQMTWLIGCNAVTRHDAVISVRAGFKDQELRALWPNQAGWRFDEKAAGMFSHCFVATR